MSEVQKITVDKLEKVIKCKKDLYESMLRNGYFLPAFKSNIVTEEFLMLAIQNKIWCPMYKDIRLLPCVKPPSKAILIDKLGQCLKRINKHFPLEKNRMPDKKWIISLLSTFMPKDEIFEKGYVAPPRPQRSQNYRTVELSQAFVSGLPPSARRVKTKRLNFLNDGKHTLRYMKMKETKDKLEKLMELEKVEIENRKIKRQRGLQIQQLEINSQSQSVIQIQGQSKLQTPSKNN